MQSNNGPTAIFSPCMSPYGLSYVEWVIKWWQRMFSISAENNPANDDTGKNCACMQTGPVWFLAGTVVSSTIVRECNIPVGKAILFPIINTERSTTELPGAPDSHLVNAATNDINQVNHLDVVIDGVAIQDFPKYRVVTPPFYVTIPTNNFMRLEPGRTRMVSDGFWILLNPMSVGKHMIHFIGRDPNLQLDVTYNLVIRRAANSDDVINIVLEEIKKNMLLLCRKFNIVFDDRNTDSIQEIIRAAIPSFEMSCLSKKNAVHRAKIIENIVELFRAISILAKNNDRIEIKPSDFTNALMEIDISKL
jgi:hypothetical protein